MQLTSQRLVSQCCIAGGGPAGLMLGLLLARAGISAVVLEKHADFLRDFRGDTIHPSTLEVMSELGWLDEFLALPHQKVRQLAGQFGATRLLMADFASLPVKARYIAMMPQWDFLNFLAEKGRISLLPVDHGGRRNRSHPREWAGSGPQGADERWPNRYPSRAHCRS